MPLVEPRITEKGFQLLNKVKQGAKLVFTDMRLGDGIRDPSKIDHTTQMLSMKLSTKISELYIKGSKSYFRAVFQNENLDTGFFVREVGVFALDPDEGEILYEYSCASDNYVDFFAQGKGATIIQETIDLVTNLSNVENITLMIDPSVLVVTRLEFNEAITKQEGVLKQLVEDDKVLKDTIDTHTKEENPHGLKEITAEEIFAMYGGDVEVEGIGDAEIGIGKASIDEMYENNLTYSTDTGIPNEQIDEMYENELGG